MTTDQKNVGYIMIADDLEETARNKSDCHGYKKYGSSLT